MVTTIHYLSVLQLWECEPHVMVKSLILHNELLRDIMQQTQGYEVMFCFVLYIFIIFVSLYIA